MLVCKSCSAPLPAISPFCSYCGVKNDIDLRGIHAYTIVRPESDRPCPLCNVAMETIGITDRETFYIERCVSCMGLFFDTNELDSLLDHTVDNVYHVDHKKLWDLNQQSAVRTERSSAYVKCPVCHKLMNRVSFGARSGVTVDQCNHGIWLDGGELRKLLAWRKAGGQLYYEQLLQDRAAAEEKKGSGVQGGIICMKAFVYLNIACTLRVCSIRKI